MSQHRTRRERRRLNDVRGRYESNRCFLIQSMKSQNRAEILELLSKVPQGTPEFQMLMLQYFTLLDGKGVELMREYANKQLVTMGLKKPETPEEIQMVQEAQQQGQEPSPEMVQAQGVLTRTGRNAKVRITTKSSLAFKLRPIQLQRQSVETPRSADSTKNKECPRLIARRIPNTGRLIPTYAACLKGKNHSFTH